MPEVQLQVTSTVLNINLLWHQCCRLHCQFAQQSAELWISPSPDKICQNWSINKYWPNRLSVNVILRVPSVTSFVNWIVCHISAPTASFRTCIIGISMMTTIKSRRLKMMTKERSARAAPGCTRCSKAPQFAKAGALSSASLHHSALRWISSNFPLLLC